MKRQNKIKILVDCHVFDNGFQGTTTYIKGLYQEFIKEKDKEFFLASCNVENLQKVFGEHQNVFYVKYKSYSKFYRLLIDIPRLIKKHEIDFTHFQYIVSPFKKGKYIVTTHDVLFLDFPEYFPFLNRIKNTFLYKLSAKKADIFLTVSEYSRIRIKKHFQTHNIQITTNAADEIFFEEYDKKEVRKIVKERYGFSDYIIFVSRWEPRKNHHLLLRSFVDLKLYEKYRLLFIGDDTIKNKEYENYYHTLSPEIKNRIISLKKVSFENMLLLLRGARLSVYPSIAEGFGIPPLESLAAGIPTISSNSTAMSDFDFLREYSFNPLDQNDFKRVLLKGLEINNEEVLEIREKLENKYSWSKAAKVLNQAIDNCQ